MVPFGSGRIWFYIAGFLGLLICVSLLWIVLGAVLKAAVGQGWGRLVPRVGAAAVAMFGVLLLVSPLLS